MKKFLIILFILLATSCFKTIDYSLDRTDSGWELTMVALDKKEKHCRRVNCSEYTVLTIEWCECMDACYKKDNIKWKNSECVYDTLDLID